MEGSSLMPLLTTTNPLENSSGNKADCYFYYYSSCTKGNACPYRHEPSALRNETMCVYWLKGSCNKPHCIYRHMEITKNRNKIACFFESQPGGCKKLHCPFFHNNVLDQPREEDVPNKPDLILPVKDSELEYETEESEMKKLQDSVAAQLKIQRKLHSQHPFGKEKDANPESPTPIIVRKSFIVPLHDGESDSESVTVSPVKSSRRERYVIADKECVWELERLKEIQKEESHLLGYSFASDDEEMDDEDHNDARMNMFDSFEEHEEEYIDDDIEEEELEDEDNFSHQTILRKTFQTKNSRENLSGFAKRVISDTLMTNVRNESVSKGSHPYLPVNIYNKDRNNQQKGIKRLRVVTEKKPSLNERLGRKFEDTIESNDNGTENSDDKIKVRVGLKDNVKSRIQLNEEKSGIFKNRILFSEAKVETDKSRKQLNENKIGIGGNRIELKESKLGAIRNRSVRSRIQLNEDKIGTIKSRLQLNEDKSKNTSFKNEEAAIVIKSLADIKAEKERLQRTNGQPKNIYSDVLPLSAYIGSKIFLGDSSSRVKDIKIKTLDEIKAEKGKVSLPTRKLNITSKKRSHSPITFDSTSKKVKLINKIEIENKKPSVDFNPRKLTLKRSSTTITANKNIVLVHKESNSVVLQSNKVKSAAKQNSSDNECNSSKTSPLSTSRKIRDLNTSTNNCSLKSGTNDNGTSVAPKVSRVDSTVIDEEELLLLDESIAGDDLDEEIDEDELLL